MLQERGHLTAMTGDGVSKYQQISFRLDHLSANA